MSLIPIGACRDWRSPLWKRHAVQVSWCTSGRSLQFTQRPPNLLSLSHLRVHRISVLHLPQSHLSESKAAPSLRTCRQGEADAQSVHGGIGPPAARLFEQLQSAISLKHIGLRRPCALRQLAPQAADLTRHLAVPSSEQTAHLRSTRSSVHSADRARCRSCSRPLLSRACTVTGRISGALCANLS